MCQCLLELNFYIQSNANLDTNNEICKFFSITKHTLFMKIFCLHTPPGFKIKLSRSKSGQFHIEL